MWRAWAEERGFQDSPAFSATSFLAQYYGNQTLNRVPPHGLQHTICPAGPGFCKGKWDAAVLCCDLESDDSSTSAEGSSQ